MLNKAKGLMCSVLVVLSPLLLFQLQQVTYQTFISLTSEIQHSCLDSCSRGDKVPVKTYLLLQKSTS